MDSSGIVAYLPQQWIGIAALVLFTLYLLGQLIEKFEAVAKLFPFFGKWWHNRKRPSLRADDVAAALVRERKKWEEEGNEVLASLDARVDAIAELAEQQAAEIADLRKTLRVFTAWSAYVSRWHHRHEVDNVVTVGHIDAPFLDFFQYEKLWDDNPIAASQLLR